MAHTPRPSQRATANSPFFSPREPCTAVPSTQLFRATHLAKIRQVGPSVGRGTLAHLRPTHAACRPACRNGRRNTPRCDTLARPKMARGENRRISSLHCYALTLLGSNTTVPEIHTQHPAARWRPHLVADSPFRKPTKGFLLRPTSARGKRRLPVRAEAQVPPREIRQGRGGNKPQHGAKGPSQPASSEGRGTARFPLSSCSWARWNALLLPCPATRFSLLLSCPRHEGPPQGPPPPPAASKKAAVRPTRSSAAIVALEGTPRLRRNSQGRRTAAARRALRPKPTLSHSWLPVFER